MAKIEKRLHVTPFEVRDNGVGQGMTFTGYAAIYNSASEPLPFREKIAPGAFTRSLRARNDIKLLWNHDSGQVLGSTRAGTLRLEETAKGLLATADLPDTNMGRDAAYLIKRGDIDSMSFGFSVPAGGDSWSADGSERTLESVRLHEVSIVAFPAYSETAGKTMVRNMDIAAKRANVSPDALADVMLKLEVGDELTESDAEVLNAVITKLTPQPESVAEEVVEEASEEASEEVTVETDLSAGMLELKKKKLEQLLKRI
jgi:HK97 family phage prohead protease